MYISDCENLNIINLSWDNGQTGALDLSGFPRKLQEIPSEWFMTLTLDKNITNLNVWSSTDENCIGKVCTFTSTHNGRNFGYQMSFTSLPTPQIIGIDVNGQNICGLTTNTG